MILFILLALGLIAVLWVGLWLSPMHRVAFRDVLDADTAPPSAGPAHPRVTIIAPGRNESAVLPTTVPTYCRQSYPNLRVLIVDDQSDDDTPAVLAELSGTFSNLRSMRTDARPDGWVGKTWAVASGVKTLEAAHEDSSDDLYCFTDADCALHPNAIATAVRVLNEKNADMLSVLPRMEFTPFCEKIGLPGLVTVLSMMFPLGSVNNPDSPLALAAGGFILIRRSAYEKVGGHESVRFHIVEDVNLARRAKSMGIRLHTRLTRNLVTTHMYENWSDMWEGLSKNAYAGMDYQPRKFWVGLIVGAAVAVLPPIYLAGLLLWAINAGGTAAWSAVALSAVINAAQVAIHARTVRHMGLPIYHALLMPVSVALYQAIAISSAYAWHYRGGNVWKGRRVTGVDGPRPT